MSTAAPSLEILRGWLNTGLLGGILAVMGFVVKPVADGLLKSRELRLQAEKNERDAKLAEDQDDRAGWTDLIKQLREEVNLLRTENAALRGEVQQLHGIISGLRRDSLTIGTLEQMRALEGVELTPEMQSAMHTLHTLKDEEKPHG